MKSVISNIMVKIGMAILAGGYFLLSTLQLQACPGCVGGKAVHTHEALPASYSHPVLVLQSGTLSIPPGGGALNIPVQYFRAYFCTLCYSFNYTGQCSYPSCSNHWDWDPQHPIEPLDPYTPFAWLDRVYSVGLFYADNIMDIYCNGTRLSYGADEETSCIIIHAHSVKALPTSGSLEFRFHDFYSQQEASILLPFVKEGELPVVPDPVFHPVMILQPGNLSLPGRGGVTSLSVQHFHTYYCNNCHVCNTDGRCNNTACSNHWNWDPEEVIEPLDPYRYYEWESKVYSIDLFYAPIVMTISCNGTSLSYGVNEEDGTIIIHCPSPNLLPSSGFLKFEFNNFMPVGPDFRPIGVPDISYPFVKGPVFPLDAGAISLTGAANIPYATAPGLIINSVSPSEGPAFGYSYQWQQKIIATGVVTDIPGATGSYYQPPVLCTPTAFRRKVTCYTEIAYTDWITVELTEVPLLVGSVSYTGVLPIASGATPGILALSTVSGGLGDYRYQWQQKDKTTGVEKDVTGATAVSYQPSSLSETTLFRCCVKSGSQTTYTDWTAIVVAIGPMDLSYYSSDAGLNYIVTCSPLEAIQDIGLLEKIDQQRASSVTYYDGLGRPIQTVLPRHTPAGNDLVNGIRYDAWGREYKKYLPVAVPFGSDNVIGGYVQYGDLETVLEMQYGFNEYHPFSETRYEASPLNRVVQQVMPGNAWAAHPLQTSYETNTAAVSTWKASSADHQYTPLTYAPGSLLVLQVADANGSPVREYKDNFEVLVMTETYDGTEWLRTRYVYDDIGLQRAVVPPQASGVDDEAYCYYYKYDMSRRVIEKKIPGAGWQYFVYDANHRLVLSQNAEQRMLEQWSFFEYDNLNRETAIYDWNAFAGSNLTRQQVQGFVDNGELSLYGTPALQIQTFYDVYPGQEDGLLPFVDNGLVSSHAENNKGYVTFKKVRILDGNNNDGFLSTTYYYDDYGRVVQTAATNHLDGTDRVSSSYDFRGNVLQALQVSTWLNEDEEEESITLRKTFEYDALKRPVAEKWQINNQPEVTVSQTVYDELLRVKKKSLHDGIEEVEYAYNIQGWLKKIQSFLFTEELYYESSFNGSGVAPQYNGNISGIAWETSRQYPSFRYAFTYDGINRLRNTKYAASSSTFANAYTEHLTYDRNGNVKTLQRYNANTLIDNLTYDYSGNRVNSITDAGTAEGFPYGTSGFAYDANGNVTADGTMTQASYHPVLNLPTGIYLSANRRINNSYTADGRKLSSGVREGNLFLSDKSRFYINNIVFNGNRELEYIVFSEGRIVQKNGNFVFEYHVKDHLGSVRVAFVPAAATGVEVIQENTYYPFGATINDLSWRAALNDNRYGFSGKELMPAFNLNWYDFEARNLNALMGRFNNIDPLAEKYYGTNPYAYCANNPLLFIDPTGKEWYSYTVQVPGADGLLQTQTGFMYKRGPLTYEEQSGAIEYTYVGMTHTTDDTYYSLAGGEFKYDKDNAASVMAIQSMMGADMTIIATINAMGGIKSFWEKYDDLISTGSDVATLFGNFMNLSKSFRGTATWFGRIVSGIIAVGDIDAFTKGELQGVALSDAIINIISMAGTPGAAISFGHTTAKQGAKAIQRLDWELRLQVDRLLPFYYRHW